MDAPRPEKRQKTHGVDDAEQTQEYLESLGDFQSLPREMLLKILGSTPQLSVHDIRMMCSVSHEFHVLCATGAVWDTIFVEQFGTDVFQKVRAATAEVGHDDVLSIEQTALLRLFAMRAYIRVGDWANLTKIGYDFTRFSTSDPIIMLHHVEIKRLYKLAPGDHRQRGYTIIMPPQFYLSCAERSTYMDVLNLADFRSLGFEAYRTGYGRPEELDNANKDGDLRAFTLYFFWLMMKGCKLRIPRAFTHGDVVDLTVGAPLCGQKQATARCGGSCKTRLYCSHLVCEVMSTQ